MRPNPAPQEGGFTLLEVLVAIALLSMGLMVLLDSQGGSMLMTQYSKDVTMATQLARARMAFLMQEIEDKKIPLGLSKSSCKDGDFSDDGEQFKGFKWKYCIKKVEIAVPDKLPGLSSGGKDDDKQAQNSQNASSLLSTMGIPMGENSSMDGIASTLAPFLGGIQTMMKARFKALQESLRELQVVITWKRNGKDYKIAVTTHMFHFNQRTGMPDGWPQPTPGTQQQP